MNDFPMLSNKNAENGRKVAGFVQAVAENRSIFQQSDQEALPQVDKPSLIK